MVQAFGHPQHLLGGNLATVASLKEGLLTNSTAWNYDLAIAQISLAKITLQAQPGLP